MHQRGRKPRSSNPYSSKPAPPRRRVVDAYGAAPKRNKRQTGGPPAAAASLFGAGGGLRAAAVPELAFALPPGSVSTGAAALKMEAARAVRPPQPAPRQTIVAHPFLPLPPRSDIASLC